ncbi:Leiomodin-2 Cardiac leiomodin [Takifugu flavidus]|uniref:Leiomodin-2 Cardiac leiomodin n=1 Tax=Takifugu flavidus TaxID=433684 RepID=A0A5C6PB72_9TELE|nr:Leiomodin-2 Cardiac leiomodin [Takifugu flavidus]
MTSFGYHRELKMYEEEGDEDEMLATLSSEELQELDRELIHLDDNIPIGMRQRVQTVKTPIVQQGRFAEEEPPSDHCAEQVTVTNDDPALSVRKDVIRRPVQQRSKTDCLDQTQNPGPDPVSDWQSRNLANVNRTLEQILSDDPSTSKVNLNNIEDISKKTLLRFAEALSTNAHVHVFSLANTHANDHLAFAISKMLSKNRFITKLNIGVQLCVWSWYLDTAGGTAAQPDTDGTPLLQPTPHLWGKDPPIRKSAQMIKQRKGWDTTKNQHQEWNPRQKNFKKSHDYKDSGDLLRDLRNVLRPSLQKRREEPNLPPPQRSSHDDLMAAIRASSIRSLKRVKFSESDLQDKRESITVVKPPSSHISRV